MGKLNIQYTAAVLDNSGYASAARGYINALLDNPNIELTVKPVSFEHEKVSHGHLIEKIRPHIDKPLNTSVNIIHLTPENFPVFKTPGKYNIGYTVWETDRLPSKWVDYCNILNEIWVPCDYNIEVFKNSGVKVPIIKIPHGVNPGSLDNAKDIDMGENADSFIFYSIFQWIERKAPLTLLKAYLTEFSPDEKVCLALKTYRLNTSEKEQQAIKNDILRLKKSLNLDNYPPIVFFGQMFPHDYILGLHKVGNCFVLPHRSEGFGLTHAEAMFFNNPTIGTGYGGNLEFMNNENSFLINYQLTPVSGMLFSNYNGKMIWADPDIMHLRQLMRQVYENQKEAKEIAEKGKANILENFNWKKIGDLMVGRLMEISNGR